VGELLDEAGLPGSRERRYDLAVIESPAAGQEWRVTIPDGQVWYLLSVHAIFHASAVVATRWPTLTVRGLDDVVLWRSIPAAGIGANQTTWCAWWHGALATTPQGWELQAGLLHPSIPLFPGWDFGTDTATRDVADTYTQIRVYRELGLLRGAAGQVAYEVERERRREELAARIGGRR
jgi:hypothetical protein